MNRCSSAVVMFQLVVSTWQAVWNFSSHSRRYNKLCFNFK